MWSFWDGGEVEWTQAACDPGSGEGTAKKTLIHHQHLQCGCIQQWDLAGSWEQGQSQHTQHRPQQTCHSSLQPPLQVLKCIYQPLYHTVLYLNIIYIVIIFDELHPRGGNYVTVSLESRLKLLKQCFTKKHCFGAPFALQAL